MGPRLIYYAFCLLRAQLSAAMSAFTSLAERSSLQGCPDGFAGQLEPPGPRGGFPWGLRQFVRPSSPGWTLSLPLTPLLIPHSSHGLSFPQPPLSPPYLDLFLMLLLFFLLVLLPSIKYLTFHSRIGILRVLLLHVPWLPRRPAALGSIPAASRQPRSCLPSCSPGSGHRRRAPAGAAGQPCAAQPYSCQEPRSPGGGFGDQPLSWSSSSGPSIPAQPLERMAGLLERRQPQQLEPSRIKVLIACDN